MLGFKTNILTRYAICYVDTERNLSEQLPYSLQQIQLKAGYEINEEPSIAFIIAEVLNRNIEEVFKAKQIEK